MYHVILDPQQHYQELFLLILAVEKIAKRCERCDLQINEGCKIRKEEQQIVKKKKGEIMNRKTRIQKTMSVHENSDKNKNKIHKSSNHMNRIQAPDRKEVYLCRNEYMSRRYKRLINLESKIEEFLKRKNKNSEDL